MMSSDLCYQKADACALRAVECSEPVMRADWLDMAAQWRQLGDDGNGQATTARLMHGARGLG